jgi:hypothetical protein
VPSVIPELLDRMGGVVPEDELIYQLDKRGLDFEQEVMERLIAEGLIAQRDDGYVALVPRRKESGARRFTDEELLDRLHLWRAIVGRPPTMRSWDPSRLEDTIAKGIANLRERVATHRQIQDLYRAGDWPSERTVRDRFGSLNAALVVAGYSPRAQGRHEPRLPRPPQVGPEALAARVEAVERARLDGRKNPLRDALYDLAVAAMTEADRL